MSAMKKESSPLHVLNPTGFEIQLFKSIVKDDAYLPTYVHASHSLFKHAILTTLTYSTCVMTIVHFLFKTVLELKGRCRDLK